jgi:hypothetical protein
MMRSVFVLLMVAGSVLAADPCVSGVPVGKRPGPYSFLVATGPQKGQQTCYICEQEDKPTAVVFARTLSDPLGKLLVKLDAEIPNRKDSGFKVWMTQLTEKADLDQLSDWAKKQAIKNVPVGGFEDADGPPAYLLNKDADVTVLLFAKKKVVANFAYRDGELTDDAIGEVMKAVPKLFDAK